uniref:Uncharacterized protein MANES_14G094300 n=1 Tax=Rhizophora mucronata TaxID=61149 RepID=A0A2P2PKF5_RHIMU
MVATAMLLCVFSGPVKALTYLVGGKLESFNLLVHNCTVCSFVLPSITLFEAMAFRAFYQSLLTQTYPWVPRDMS